MASPDQELHGIVLGMTAFWNRFMRMKYMASPGRVLYDIGVGMPAL